MGSARSGAEKNTTPTANAAPSELPVAEARGSTKANSDKKAAQQNAKNQNAQAKNEAAARGFKLRISGSEMDLSRSQGVSDETRRELRERFALLDADDQTAQLLALKNNVKQIEKRLNELQLKLAASSPSMPVTGATVPLSSPVPTTPSAVNKVDAIETLTVPVVAPTLPTVTDKPAVGPTVAAKTTEPTPPATLQIVPPKIAPLPDSISSDSWLTWAIALLSVLALVALTWWVLQSRHRRDPIAATDAQMSRTSRESIDDFNTWINDLESTSPTSPLLDQIAAKKNLSRGFRDRQNETKQGRDKQDRRDRDNVTEAASFVEAAPSFVSDGAARTAENVKTPEALNSAESFEWDSLKNSHQPRAESRQNPIMDSLVSPPPSGDVFSLSNIVQTAPTQQAAKGSAVEKAVAQNSGSFELDIDLNDLATLPANSSDQTSEDRVRRLRYMQERYPELAARTVSIDEPKSIIDAARLYYEENQLAKACELLIYSVEERPQEIRYWLAKFELFRLEKMSRQFGELADKFQLLFGNTDAWPKVRDIGHELDPGNPLFAAATGTGTTSPEKFDPANENWLNAHASSDVSAQHISQALVADLRSALFGEYRVTHADFQGVPDLLNSADARA